MAEFKDYYAILGVAREATAAEIKKAFRKLARTWHPDVAKDKAGAEAKFKEINEAREVLGDPEKRAKYDRLGADWEHGGTSSPAAAGGGAGAWGGPGDGQQGADDFHFGGTGFSDFFEQYFSGGSRYGFPRGARAGGPEAGPSRPRRGGDVEGDLMVTLEEAMLGTVRPISMQTVNRQTGKVDRQEFQVRIPPGATDGRRIRVPGQGEAGQGGAEAGDLYLRVRHAAHPDFTTQGADLRHELELAPWEAVLGAEVVVPTLDGSIKLKIPPFAENGQVMRVRTRGLPKGKNGERGDFLVTLLVRLPEALTEAERALWEQLSDTSTFQPRAAK